MKNNLKFLFALTTFLFASFYLYAIEKPVEEKNIVRTLETNSKTKPILAKVSLNSISIDGNGNITTDILTSSKFKVQSNLDMTALDKRIEYSAEQFYIVEFVLTSNKPKVYLITKIYGLETVDQYKQRLCQNELNAQRVKNEKNGLGSITDEEVYSQRLVNKSNGLGDIVDKQVEEEKYKNRTSGYGDFTNLQIENQILENQKKGLGAITNIEVLLEKNTNKKEGLGELTNHQIEEQREKNKKSGLGSITDAQVEKEKADNQKLGLGCITNIQAEFQCTENEKKGLGKITDEQVIAECSANENAGLGKITNFEYRKKLMLTARKYESKNKWIYALGEYYDILENTSEAVTGEIYERFKELINSINNGIPGIGEFDEFTIHDGWKDLCQEFQEYWSLQDSIYDVKAKELVRGKLDYNTRTCSYSFELDYKRLVDSKKYRLFYQAIFNGFNKAYRFDWEDMNRNWIYYYNPKRYEEVNGNCPLDFSKGGVSITKEYDYVKDCYVEKDTFKNGAYEIEYVIVDNDGKSLSEPYIKNIEEKVFTMSGISQNTMKTIESGKGKIKLLRIGFKKNDDVEWIDLDKINSAKDKFIYNIK